MGSKALFVLVSYQLVSVYCFWPSSRWTNEQDSYQIDNLFNNLFNDMSLDISFPPTADTFVGSSSEDDFFQNVNNLDYMDSDNDYYVDEAPSSMLQFPSFLTNFRSSPPVISNAKPLYLMVQSSDIRPKTSTFALTKTNKVNGDTWRYTMDTNGDNNVFSNIWSSRKMYLCHDAQCSSDNGLEMTDAFGRSGADFVYDKYPNNYMHLVPSSTLQPLYPLPTDLGDEQYDDDITLNFDDILGTISSLWSKARVSYNTFMNQWLGDDQDSITQANDDLFRYLPGVLPVEYAYQDDSDITYDYDEGSRLDSELNYDGVYDSYVDYDDDERYQYDDEPEAEMNDDADADRDDSETEQEDINEMANGSQMIEGQVLADSETQPDGEDTLVYEEEHDLVVIEMTVIIVLIMICGVLYAGYKFMLSRREKRRENDYYNIDMNAQLLANK